MTARLNNRVRDLEQRTSQGIKRWVRILRYEDQSVGQAYAAYAAEHGPIDDNMGVILRVIINKPGPAPARA